MSEERQRAAARGLLEELARVIDVPLAIRLWDGSRVPLCRAGEPKLEIAVASSAVLGSLLRSPHLETVTNHYATGRLELHGGDLLELLSVLEAGRGNRSSRRAFGDLRKLSLVRHALPLLLSFGGGGRPEGSAARGEGSAAAPHSLESDRTSVQFHYDLGNAFYALFLDAEMQYSCGYFEEAECTLEQAQCAKLEMTCRKLRLQPGERFLDVGCGWGGLVCHAAREYGVEALGVTLSEAQYEFAQAKVAALGLEEQVTVELRDYRDLSADGRGGVGYFDKIASIGMVEHVGIVNYGEYFSRLAALLRDRGLLLNHGITRGAKRSKRRFRRRRPEKRLMLRYVFPGHELDHIGHTLEVMEAHGFEVRDVEDWREHYEKTTRLWFERLAARPEEAGALIDSERYRIWLAYLAGVSSAFKDGSLRIYQVLASRHRAKGPSELPLTRADLYRR